MRPSSSTPPARRRPLAPLGLALTLAALAGCAGPGTKGPAAPPVAGPPVTVLFDHPERFRDVRDSFPGTEEGRNEILEKFRTFLTARARRALGGRYGLSVTFTDIRLAGDFEPWRGPNWEEVRIIRDIYPPSLSFDYTITTPDGRPLRSGHEDLRDAAFQMRLFPARDEPLCYEEDLLDDWVRSALAPLVSGGRS